MAATGTQTRKQRRPKMRVARWAPPNAWGLVPTASSTLRHRDRRAAGPRALQVSGLTVRASNGTVVVDDVSFSVAKGSVVAVVGPTGAGKTMLLNALAGRFEIESGSIRLNGEEVAGEEARRMGYVPQEDFLHPQLGLRRTLEYAARLRLSPAMDPSERARRIEAALTELDLLEQADLPIASLSGGQRKRANVAVELLSEPEVLILDEPTSGLDPGREKSVLSMLRTLADHGRTVLTVTHSPNALAACDRVLFLAPGGRVAFFGPPDVAVSYFRNADPADVFLALDRASAQSWKERFRSHPAHEEYVAAAAAEPARTGHSTAPKPAPQLPGWIRQLRTLTSRYLKLIRSDRRHVALLTLQGPILGVLLWATLAPRSLAPLGRHALPALVSQHRIDVVSVALFLSLSVTWLGVANAIREIVKEHKTLVREEGTGLSLRAYVGAKAMTLGAVTMVQAAVLALIACGRQGVPAHGAVLGPAYPEIVLATAIGALAAVALGLMLSALVTSPDKALTVLPMTLVAELVFSGAWVPLNAPGLRQLRDLSSAHWTVHAVRSTVKGDAGDWWLAIFALLGLTAAALLTTMALVQRSVLPTRIGEVRARLAPHTMPGLGLVISAATIVVLVLGVSEHAGTASDYVPRPKPSALTAAIVPKAAPAPVAVRADVVPPLPAPSPDALATAEAATAELAAKTAEAAAAADAAQRELAKQQAALAAAKRAAATPAAPVAATSAPPPAPATTTTVPSVPTEAAAAAQPQRGLVGGLLHGLLGWGS